MKHLQVDLLFFYLITITIIQCCYIFRKDSTDPCRDKQCGYGSRCVVSSDGRYATCQCPTNCPNYGDHSKSRPVCGTNGQDYPDLCTLRMDACSSNSNITIKYDGKCDPCSEVTCTESEICQLNENREPVCRCGDNCPLEFTPVCGSDGKTYSNECSLRREACRSKKSLRIIFHGKCSSGANPCLNVKCMYGEECTINKYGIARCECPTNCERVMRPVCTKDSRMFSSECEMSKVACSTRSNIEIAYTGLCKNRTLCTSQSCQPGAICIEKYNKAICECPVCSEEFNPVCGSDGITYGNECKLRLEACKHNRNITIFFNGPCNGCESKKCEFYSVCESDKSSGSYCVCPKHCENEDDQPVCGTNGITYKSECQLRLTSCKMKQYILVAYKGDCDLCRNVDCKYGAYCNAGKCECPTDCHGAGNELVCASNLITYPNECELQKAACLQPSNATVLNIIFYGDCKEKFTITEPPKEFTSDSRFSALVVTLPSKVSPSEGDVCKEIHCDFDATCELGPDNFPRCTCKFDCNNTISTNNKPVCASDLRMYPSMCVMKLESCQRQEELRLRPLDLCQGMKVKPCNGESPLKHPVTDKDLDCGNGPLRQDCPSGSYCHQTTRFAKCCAKVDKNVVQKTCENSWYGCCPDGKSAAQGTNHEGCPFLCGCNKLGSYSDTCDMKTQQCTCKPGVGGLKCDRCKTGYWGLPKISSGHRGCIPCGCSVFGSVREDCEQMTGRCVCKPGIQGQKCTICNSVNKILGPNGCVSPNANISPPTSCSEHFCYFDGVCKEQNGIAICECNMECAEAGEKQIVCGSDDQTYASECHIRLQACQLQKDIVIKAFGSCKESQDMDIKLTNQYSYQIGHPDKLRSKFARHLSSLSRLKNGMPKISPNLKIRHVYDYMKINDDNFYADKSMTLIDHYGNDCVVDSDCTVRHSVCIDHKCNCLPGYVMLPERKICILQNELIRIKNY